MIFLKKFLEFLKEMENRYPYRTIIIFIIFTSLSGITIEYIMHKDIIISGLWGTIFTMIFWLVYTFIKNKRD